MTVTDTFPDEIRKRLSGYEAVKDDIGRSSASVLRFTGNSDSCFLKIQEISPESIRERDILTFLSGKLPVPEIFAYSEQDGSSYILMSELQGEMTCSRKNLEDIFMVSEMLAEGLLMLWDVDLKDCPFDERVERKLEAAHKHIIEGKVDMDDLDDENRRFSSPEEIYHELISKRPAGEDLVFSHGDYCLPNIFIKDRHVTGFLDLGRAGVSDRWQDISLCIRSMRYNFRRHDEKEIDKAVELFLKNIGVSMDEEKYRYFTLLDELF